MKQLSNNFKRISKKAAEKLYNEGVMIMMIPCECAPENVWGVGCWVDNSNGETFEEKLDYFAYYNCQYPEMGIYAAYYVEK